MPTERSKAMAERRARREAEQAGRKNAEAAGKLVEAARGEKPGWYDKKEVASYFATSTRTIERWMKAGMPHATIGAKAKFKPAECEAWLERHGHMERKGDHR